MPRTPLAAIAVLLLALGAASCSDDSKKASKAPARPIGDAHAIQVCQAQPISGASKLRAGFDTTSKVVVDWLNSKNPPNFGRVVPRFFENRPDTDPIAVCFVDGAFKGAPGGATPDRGVHAIASNGETASVMAASRHKLPLVRPEVALEHPTTTTVPEGAIALPAFDIGRGMPEEGVLDAVGLVGDAARGCVWVTVGGVRHAAVWTPGAIARFDPVRIYDAQGVLRWTAGEVRRVQGGTSIEADTAKVPSQCRTEATAITLGF